MLIKKKYNFAVLFALVVYVGVFASDAQTKQSNVLYSEPVRLRLKGDYKTVKEEENAVLLREKFYPIGWSKDGKFAFYVEPADEACGCYFAHLVIQDLRTDKILWERKYESSEEKVETLPTYWKKNQKEFSRKLAQYGIVAQKRFNVQNSAFKYQKDILTPELTDNTKMDDEQRVSGNVILQLISKGKGKKTIYEKKFDPKEYGGFLGAELSGSLLSPFEARTVIIMVETYRGYEGPPHITKIRLVGATLTTGF